MKRTFVYVVIVSASVLCLSVRSHGQIDSGLLGYWNFDDSTASDATGNGLDGLIVGGRTTDGVINAGIEFDGLGDYIEFGDIDTLEGLARMSISFWVWFESLDGFTPADPWKTAIPVVSKWRSSEPRFLDSVSYNLLLQGDEISYAISDGDSNVILNATHSICEKQWHHVTVVFDSGSLVIYQDAMTILDTAVAVSTINNSHRTLYWGNWCFLDDASCRTMPGKMDEVRFYDRAVGLEDVLLLYLQGKDLMCCAVPGDANHDTKVNIGDVVFLVQWIFGSKGHVLCCYDEANIDRVGAVSISDVSYFISWLFSGGPAPTCGSM